MYAATGRRKEAVARVQVTPGKGEFAINGLAISDYLQRETLVDAARRPIQVAELEGRIDVNCTTNGGGKAGQADAIRLAVSRALVQMNPDLRKSFRYEGLMTRDPREVERKKYGRPKARKRFQYSKR